MITQEQQECQTLCGKTNNMEKLKYLCVCDGGNVRSQALAYVLHDIMGHEAIPVGRWRVSKETMNMMCKWADKIIIMQPHMEESIEKKFKKKLLCIDVGIDRFGVYVHPELLQIVNQGALWLEQINSNEKENHQAVNKGKKRIS